MPHVPHVLKAFIRAFCFLYNCVSAIKTTSFCRLLKDNAQMVFRIGIWMSVLSTTADLRSLSQIRREKVTQAQFPG